MFHIIALPTRRVNSQPWLVAGLRGILCFKLIFFHIPSERYDNAHMKKLLPFLRKYTKETLLGPAFKLIEAVFELIVPLVMANMIDIGVANRDRAYVLRSGGILLLLGVVGLCSTFICQYMASKASQGFGTLLRNAVFKKFFAFSRLSALGGQSSLLNRLSVDVNQLQLAVAMLIRLVVRAPFLVLGGAIMATLVDARTAVIFWLAIPLIALALYMVMSLSVPYYKGIQQRADGIFRLSRENLAGTRVIRAFSRQESELRRFDTATTELETAAIRVGRISTLAGPMTYVIANLAIVAILWFGGARIDSGALTQGELVALINYMTQILTALVVVSNLVVIFTKAAASAQRVCEILDAPEDVAAPAVPRLPEPDTGAPRIEFKDVAFAYPGADSTIFDGLSFTLRSGERLGIIGGTGAGKSTVAALIPRLIDATAGEVLVDGLDVREYDPRALRRRIGYAPQKALLFEGTIRQNLLYSKEDATDEQMWEALETARASEFVSRLDGGLDFKLTRGGGNLSGGQRQRLTVARAVLRRPEILILDDSASALDYLTERELRERLFARLPESAVVTISQRVASVMCCDEILVLDDGRCWLGCHETLLRDCPIYREIYDSQLGAGGETA